MAIICSHFSFCSHKLSYGISKKSCAFLSDVTVSAVHLVANYYAPAVPIRYATVPYRRDAPLHVLILPSCGSSVRHDIWIGVPESSPCNAVCVQRQQSRGRPANGSNVAQTTAGGPRPHLPQHTVRLEQSAVARLRGIHVLANEPCA